jgi:pyruvate/2-oxoglutarate dehydrogenase complex dihydrolipoamide acyltransferase (E2) component
MRSRSAPGFFLLAPLILLAALSASACRKPATDEDGAATEAAPKVVLAVSAARVAVKPMRQELALPGVTAALRTLTLRAPAAGRVVGLAVTTGDSVHRGEVIGHIVNREEDAAQAGVEAAQKIDPDEAASLARSVKRYSGGPGIAVRVPENALVSQRVVSPGQIVNEFDPLVELVDPSSVYVDAQAPINRLGALKAGMDATVVSALKPGVVYPARVWSLSPSFSPGGTTAPVWVQFTGPDRISEIGASVEVHVTIKFVPDAIVIPAAALFEDAERHNSYVFTVGADSRAHRTVVRTGIRNPSEVQVTQGLKPGDLVITSGGYALSDGLEVRASVTPVAGATPVVQPAPQAP